MTYSGKVIDSHQLSTTETKNKHWPYEPNDFEFNSNNLMIC